MNSRCIQISAEAAPTFLQLLCNSQTIILPRFLPSSLTQIHFPFPQYSGHSSFFLFHFLLHLLFAVYFCFRHQVFSLLATSFCLPPSYFFTLYFPLFITPIFFTSCPLLFSSTSVPSTLFPLSSSSIVIFLPSFQNVMIQPMCTACGHTSKVISFRAPSTSLLLSLSFLIFLFISFPFSLQLSLHLLLVRLHPLLLSSLFELLYLILLFQFLLPFKIPPSPFLSVTSICFSPFEIVMIMATVIL